MLSAIASIFQAPPPPSAHERLKSQPELALLYLFAHGNLKRSTFVAQATALLGTAGPPPDERELAALFDAAARDGSLSYAQLRFALDAGDMLLSVAGARKRWS